MLCYMNIFILFILHTLSSIMCIHFYGLFPQRMLVFKETRMQFRMQYIVSLCSIMDIHYNGFLPPRMLVFSVSNIILYSQCVSMC